MPNFDMVVNREAANVYRDNYPKFENIVTKMIDNSGNSYQSKISTLEDIKDYVANFWMKFRLENRLTYMFNGKIEGK